MDAKTKAQLEQAKAHCYAWRLQDAYAIFRRFFDRLPFEQEKEHAEYIGMYVRILLELGKDFELKFYCHELERLYATTAEPAIGYQLAYVYVSLSEPRPNAAKKIFEAILQGAVPETLRTKAKVMLMFLHARDSDYTACRSLLDSIQEPSEDFGLRRIVKIWMANILRHEGALDRAEHEISSVLAECSVQEDWYAYLSARIEEVKIANAMGDTARVGSALRELRRVVKKHRCRSLHHQLENLERTLNPVKDFGTLRMGTDEDRYVITYQDQSLVVERSTVLDRLTLLLLRKGSLSKKRIAERLYSREYDAKSDDPRIHYHIHSLRKRLAQIGLPPEAIRRRGDSYRLLAQVEVLEDNL